MIRFNFVTIVVCACCLTICRGQDFTTVKYSIAEGMPSSEVYDVFEDREGFLWFGTDNGVVRFDGFELEKFNIDKGLTDPVVFGFFEDKKGRLWFRTYSGRLCFFDKGSIHPYPFNDILGSILPLGEINFVYDSDREQLHFAIEKVRGKIDSLGSVSFDRVSDEGLHIEIIQGFPIPRAMAGYEGLIKSITIDGKEFSIDDRDAKTVHRLTRVLRFKDKLYFSIKKKIYEYDGSSVKFVYEGPGTVISMAKDREDNIWIGYLYEGAERFEGGDFAKSWRPVFVRHNSVTKVHQDAERNIWITTLEDGVYQIPNIQITNASIETPARVRAVIPFNNTFLVGDEAGHLFEFERSSRKLKERRLFDSPILTGFVDSRKQIWISTVNGIFLFDSTLKERNRSEIYSCIDMVEDGNGIVWGYGNHTMKSFDKDGNLRTILFFNLRYRQCYVDDSLFFLAGRIGLEIRDRSAQIKPAPAFFHNVKISDIAALTDSSLIISTLGSGFVIMNKNTWAVTQFNSRNKFFADNVYSIQRIGDVFWIATEKGVARVTLNELLTPHPGFQYLTRTSGLIANKINFMIAQPDRVLAFSDEGVSEIPLPVTRFANNDPRFYVKRIQINQRAKKIEDLSTLQHDENNVALIFGYRSFNNPNVFTRYKLEGEDKWTYPANNEIRFNALAPGSYTLILEYSVDNVHWTKAAGIPTIAIAPPWWQTWYFKIGMSLLTALLIYLYIRYQVRVYRNHQLKLIQSELEAIEQERKRIAKDLHDSVGTDFSAIKMMVSQVLKKHNEPKSEEIETQFQSTIQDIKSIIYGLSPPGLERYGLMAALGNYIEKLNGSIPVQIHLKTFGPEVKNPKITLALFRIIQELISNSLKHSNASAIRLHVSSFDDLV
ncbi:MAG TPA: two-component regulator propeller domain-containing protein, partial [Chryseosolibacter sp.]